MSSPNLQGRANDHGTNKDPDQRSGHTRYIDWSTIVQDGGLTELSTGDSSPMADLVFVHGLQGHPYRTWACPRGKKNKAKASVSLSSLINSRHEQIEVSENPTAYWPGDFITRDFPELRVLTYGYDSRASNFFKGSANQNTVLEHGNDLLHHLSGNRRRCLGRPLIFICHSLGGLVVKEV